MANEPESAATAPRPGAIIAMIVGLLLFFGMVSRVGRMGEDGPLSSVTSRGDEARESLRRERRRAIAVIGGESNGNTPAAGSAEKRDEAEPAAPESAPQHMPHRRAPSPSPRRPRPRPTEEKSPRFRLPTSPRGARYCVQPGDTLYRIALSHYGDGRRWRKIVEANPGLRADNLRVGQTLWLPAPPATARVENSASHPD